MAPAGTGDAAESGYSDGSFPNDHNALGPLHLLHDIAHDFPSSSSSDVHSYNL